MPPPFTITFSAGHKGDWCIERILPVIGESLPTSARLAVYDDTELKGPSLKDASAVWQLKGVVSHPRHTTGAELKKLAGISAPLRRAGATHAALIPIRKSEAWWIMGQDQRRAIFEDSSQHIARSMKYLPAIARRLHHARDLGEAFDFLTWFEYAPADADRFDDLLGELRTTEEWRYVEREVDVRLVRE